MHPVSVATIPWVKNAAEDFSRWLINETEGQTWTRENMRLPGIYRWSVDYITYEALYTDKWSEPWFQEGIIAFGLIALELDNAVKFILSDAGELLVETPSGSVLPLSEFLSGESLMIRHDPDYADLAWDPVDAVGHLLTEYSPDEPSFDAD